MFSHSGNVAIVAVRAARDDHRDLLREIDRAFQDHLVRGAGAPDLVEIFARGDRLLALAVVAERRRLQNRGPADLLDRALQLARISDRAERRDRNARVGEEIFLAQPVLRDVQDRSRRANIALLRRTIRPSRSGCSRTRR